jgi:hypothetical protein
LEERRKAADDDHVLPSTRMIEMWYYSKLGSG